MFTIEIHVELSILKFISEVRFDFCILICMVLVFVRLCAAHMRSVPLLSHLFASAVCSSLCD